jgi:hypothetical protein
MPDDGHPPWGPYQLMPGATINVAEPVVVTPGGDGTGICITDVAGTYRYAFTAAPGWGWAVTTAEGSAELTGRVEVPAGSAIHYGVSPEEAAETRRGEERRIEELRRAREERERAWKLRTELAEARLLAWMDDQQRADYARMRRFCVTASDGSRWQIVADGSQTGNVLLMNACGEPVCSYCAHPYGVPQAETYLAQALALITDVAKFRAVANIYSTYLYGYDHAGNPVAPPQAPAASGYTGFLGSLASAVIAAAGGGAGGSAGTAGDLDDTASERRGSSVT